jgi:hypothetical protein
MKQIVRKSESFELKTNLNDLESMPRRVLERLTDLESEHDLTKKFGHFTLKGYIKYDRLETDEEEKRRLSHEKRRESDPEKLELIKKAEELSKELKSVHRKIKEMK